MTAYGIVNLFVAMVVAAMSQVAQEEAEEQGMAIEDLTQEVNHLRNEIRELTRKLDRQ
ncbi:MAG: hypothetical protein RIB80_17505 [Rhodospirillales bacterium]